MKRTLLVIAALAASFGLALAWACSSLPLPPLPEAVWHLIYRAALPVMPSDVHAQEAVLEILGIWATLIAVVALVALALPTARYRRSVAAAACPLAGGSPLLWRHRNRKHLRP